jgi:SAM-dependent methyltransferase
MRLLAPSVGAGYRSNEPEICSERLYDYFTVDVDNEFRPDFVADASNLPLNWHGQFGTVVCTEVLEHTPSPWVVTREIHRVLQPHGHLILTVPFWVPIHEKRRLSDYWRFTPKAVARLLEEFTIVTLKTSGTETKPLGIYVYAQKNA